MVNTGNHCFRDAAYAQIFSLPSCWDLPEVYAQPFFCCLEVQFCGEIKVTACFFSVFLQKWKMKGSFIQHFVSGLCLENQTGRVVTNPCQAGVPGQQWELLQAT